MKMRMKKEISREIANAIELFVDDKNFKLTVEEVKAILVVEHPKQDWEIFGGGRYAALKNITTFDLMQCVVNGYEVEKTLKDKFKERVKREKESVKFYKYQKMDTCEKVQEAYSRGFLSGVEETVKAFELDGNFEEREERKKEPPRPNFPPLEPR
jgi:hypothetical protein